MRMRKRAGVPARVRLFRGAPAGVVWVAGSLPQLASPPPPQRERRMVPHTGQRPAGQAPTAAHTAGFKRKAPTAKGKGVASADPERLLAERGEGKGKAKRKAPQAGKVKPAARRQGGVAEGMKGGAAVEDGEGKGKAKGKAKVKSDIDDIFAGVKRLKAEKAEEEAERAAKKKKLKEDHKRRQANPFTGEGGPERRWAWADEVKPVRFDDEGLPIYTWESLRIGQGGGTALCPFDCDCCF